MGGAGFFFFEGDFAPPGAGDWLRLAVCSGAEGLQKGHSSGVEKLSATRPPAEHIPLRPPCPSPRGREGSSAAIARGATGRVALGGSAFASSLLPGITLSGSLGGSAVRMPRESPSAAASPPASCGGPHQPKGSSPGPADVGDAGGLQDFSPRYLCVGNKAAFCLLSPRC